jgi:hypothetical protein
VYVINFLYYCIKTRQPHENHPNPRAIAARHAALVSSGYTAAQQESHMEENPEKYFSDPEAAAESGQIPHLEIQDYHREKRLDINKATADELLEPGIISAQPDCRTDQLQGAAGTISE